MWNFRLFLETFTNRRKITKTRESIFDKVSKNLKKFFNRKPLF